MRFDDIKWKTKLCPVGRKCWCRTIITLSGDEVIGGGFLDKEFAEYIVKIHNHYVEKFYIGKIIKT